tara:strand:+ start:535 stop:819 length:285 start_codon:yes stop_codon:yes gene_type:complete
MIRRLLALATLGVLLSGCYMVPMAMVGPAISGFSSTSIVQATVTTTLSYSVKKKTGKTIAGHAFSAAGSTLNRITNEAIQQTFLPVDPKYKLDK